MRIRWTTRIATAAGLLTLVAGIATGGGPARAAARPTPPAAVGATTAVAASATSAWAVGPTGVLSPRTVILHWNGKTRG